MSVRANLSRNSRIKDCTNPIVDEFLFPLVRPLFTADHIPNSQKNNLDIQREAPVLEVHNIVLHALLHEARFSRLTTVTVDLRVAGDTRCNKMPYLIAFNLLGVFFELTYHVRPGTNNGHVTQKYIHELREFIEVGFSQELSDACNARITLHGLKLGVVVNRHRPELIAFEQLVLLSRPKLLKYDRPRRVKPYRKCDDRNDNGKYRKDNGK